MSDRSELIHQLLENSAKNWPDKTAVVQGEDRFSYRHINLVADRLASAFAQLGIQAGNRVVLLFENSVEYIVTYYAVLKSGAIAVPISSDIKPYGLVSLLQELEPRLLISSQRFERMLKAAEISWPASLSALIIKSAKLSWGNHAVSVLAWNDLVEQNVETVGDISIDPDAVATIIYTSGSTGASKGVMLTHRNIVANTQSICSYQTLSEHDIHMVVLPFFYVMGKSLLNSHVAVGGTLVLNNKFAYPAAVLKQMADEQVTGFSGVPSTYSFLLHHSPFEEYRDKLQALRFCAQAGGHMSRTVKEALLSVLPEQTELYIMYGATEAAARLSYVEPQRLQEKIESIGRPIPGVELNVVGEDGKSLPVGEQGEIVAAGTNIMCGYWRNPVATDQALKAGRYYTGDLGYCDADGYFFLCGRKDVQLKVGGHRINPLEIEDAIQATGLVVEVSVAGKPDDLLGSRLVAYVVLKNSDIGNQQLLGACASLLPRYKIPAEIKRVKALPKTAAGKIDRVKCIEQL